MLTVMSSAVETSVNRSVQLQSGPPRLAEALISLIRPTLIRADSKKKKKNNKKRKNPTWGGGFPWNYDAQFGTSREKTYKN